MLPAHHVQQAYAVQQPSQAWLLLIMADAFDNSAADAQQLSQSGNKECAEQVMKMFGAALLLFGSLAVVGECHHCCTSLAPGYAISTDVNERGRTIAAALLHDQVILPALLIWVHPDHMTLIQLMLNVT